ncbi:MAG: hypothetical protein ABW174_07205 [Flavitalea sp.]
MEKRNPILEELRNEGSTLGNFPAVTPYSVPAGYFDSLSGNIMDKIRAMENKNESEDDDFELPAVLKGISKKIPYNVPDGYFDSLADKLNIDEEVSELMLSIKKLPVYEVPGGYFENLPGKILAKIKHNEETKVIKGNFAAWKKFAAAAVVTGVIFTTGFFILNRDKKDQQFASVTNAGLEQKTAQASDEEILNYLEAQSAPTFDVQQTSGSKIQADAILDLLADVSDDDLQQYALSQSDTKLKFN